MKTRKKRARLEGVKRVLDAHADRSRTLELRVSEGFASSKSRAEDLAKITSRRSRDLLSEDHAKKSRAIEDWISKNSKIESGHFDFELIEDGRSTTSIGNRITISSGRSAAKNQRELIEELSS